MCWVSMRITASVFRRNKMTVNTEEGFSVRMPTEKEERKIDSR